MSTNTKRRAHSKVKTGCVTCKARRIKCTEERPECSKCIRSGRICGGYTSDGEEKDRTALIRQSEQRSPMEHDLPVQSILHCYNGDSMSALEVHSLQFFHVKTIPALTGFFDSSLWQRLTLQLSHTEPALRHAMIAVGFLQKLNELYGFPALDMVEEDSSAKIDRQNTFALQQYLKSVALLRERLAKDNTDTMVTLVACLLFVCLEFLRGERHAALGHLKSGVEIINSRSSRGKKAIQGSPGKDDYNDTPRDLIESDLAPTFARLSLLQTLRRQPSADAYNTVVQMDTGVTEFSADQPFNTLAEARTVSIDIATDGIRFMQRLPTFATPTELESERMKLLYRFQDWSDAYDPFFPSSRFQMGDIKTCEERASAMLRVNCSVSVIMTNVMKLPFPDEWEYDEHTDRLKGMLNTLEAIVRLTNGSGSAGTGVETQSFYFDMGITGAMFFIAVKCRDPVIRRRAVSLLHQTRRKEGTWDAITLAKVAEMHISIEEESLLECRTRRASLSPGLDDDVSEARILGYDMNLRDPKNPSKQEIKFKVIRKSSEGPILEDRKEVLYYQGVRTDEAISTHKVKSIEEVFGLLTPCPTEPEADPYYFKEEEIGNESDE